VNAPATHSAQRRASGPPQRPPLRLEGAARRDKGADGGVRASRPCLQHMKLQPGRRRHPRCHASPRDQKCVAHGFEEAALVLLSACAFLRRTVAAPCVRTDDYDEAAHTVLAAR
jgi:hypothetical protein